MIYTVKTYVDRPETRPVASSHVLVERLDGVRTAELTELLVHVVGTGTRVVTDPDTEVLDLQGLLLVNLKETNMVARTACFGQLSHSACHLNGCKGPHRDNTYNIDTNDFTIGLFDLFKLAEEVPEAGLGNNFVGCEDAHAVELGGGLSIGGQVPADDLIFLDSHSKR